MRNILLAATAATALMAGTVLAYAQEQKQLGGAAQQSPSAQSQVQPKGAHPSAGTQGRAEERGKADDAMKSQAQGEQKGQGAQRQGQAEPKAGHSNQRTQGRAEQHGKADDAMKSHAQGELKGQGEQGKSQQPNNERGRTQGQVQERRNEHGRTQGQVQPRQGEEGRQGQAEQGRTSGSVTLSQEQRTRIRETVLVKSGAPRVSSVNFSLTVGTVVPRTVKVVTVPETLVEIHPAWRGFLYFIVGDQIIIVDPHNHEIVEIIAV